MNIIINHYLNPLHLVECAVGERIARFYYCEDSAVRYSRLVEARLRELFIEERYNGTKISFVRTID